MQIIYRASDIVEAHIVAGMLKSEGIDSYVGGHYLQGAIGDLSPLSFANVFVEDSDMQKRQLSFASTSQMLPVALMTAITVIHSPMLSRSMAKAKRFKTCKAVPNGFYITSRSS